MKANKLIGIIICATFITLIGCGVKNSVSSNTDVLTEDNTSEIMSEANSVINNESKDTPVDNSDRIENVATNESEENTDANTQDVNDKAKEISGEVDVDLTTMSSLLVYSEVYNMVFYPERYVGKTVRMKGVNSVYYDEEAGKYYFACFISDATACCQQGIEYQLTDEYLIPDDYPEDLADVCVEGRFDTYMEGEYTYCVLRDAVLLKEK